MSEANARSKPGRILQVAVHCLLTSTISLHSRIHSEVARHFTFTDALHALALEAVTRLRAVTGMSAFNGVHLRVEDDFSHVKDAGAGCYVNASMCSRFGMWPTAQGTA